MQVIYHKGYKTREDFDMAVHESLVAAGIEIVCLAGFMRILSGIIPPYPIIFNLSYIALLLTL